MRQRRRSRKLDRKDELCSRSRGVSPTSLDRCVHVSHTINIDRCGVSEGVSGHTGPTQPWLQLFR